jgi:AraC family transcriptional regulator
LSEIAAECRISTRHFTRAFCQSFGIPPHRWLLKQRVEIAKALLLQKEPTLAEIAKTSGFSDQSHFTRVFVQAAGVSPGVWRRQNQA